MRHHLVLVHRGAGHVHKHAPTCVCGWQGIPRRRKQEAVLQYRQHESAVTHTTASAPRPVTPVDRLPEALR